MFFYLSKILWFLLQPSSLIALLIAGGLAMMKTTRARLARRLIGSGVAALVILGLSPLGGALILPLEERFPRPDVSQPGTKVDGIIVLGGAEDQRVGRKRGVMSFNEAGERMMEAAGLARQFPQARIVISGGSANMLDETPPEAEATAKFFAEFGIPPERLIVEARSRNTHENAVFTSALVKPAAGEHWLLVTSAFHMPRAMGCFRKAGFAVEAFPVDYRTSGLGEVLQPFSSIPEGLRRVDFVLKEYVGLLTYYVSGRTDALFPSP